MIDFINYIESYFWPHTRILLWAGAFFILLEILIPAHQKQKLLRKDTYLDLIYSYVLPILIYPASFLLQMVLINNFWGITPSQGKVNEVNKTEYSLKEHPKFGKIKFDSIGSFSYVPEKNFKGNDHFIILEKHPGLIITKTFITQALAQPSPNSISNSATQKSIVKLHLVNEQFSGKATEGWSGWFFQLRKSIVNWPIFFQLLLATFLVDFVGYWRHRWMHSKFLWPFHTIHHAPKELDWLTNERFHPINNHISYLFSLTTLILFFEDPFVYSLCMPFRRAYGMYIHSNVKISYGFLNFVFATPLFHRWHHSDTEVYNKNYATFFSGIDWVFGTFYLPKDKNEPKSYGLFGEKLDNHFWSQMIYPFIKIRKLFSG